MRKTSEKRIFISDKLLKQGAGIMIFLKPEYHILIKKCVEQKKRNNQAGPDVINITGSLQKYLNKQKNL